MIETILSGSPYEMGYRHGQVLRPLVDAMVRYELRQHAHAPSQTDHLEIVRQRVERAAPELLEELRGIADGSGLPFALLLEVNLRILHYCTVITFVDSSEGPLLGKNLDFPAYAYQALFVVEPDEGYAFTHIGCAGSIASYGGLNAAGLAMGHAAVPLGATPDSDGMPVAFIRRVALQYCATTEEAISLSGQHEAWKMGDNLMFLDRHGDAAVIEKRPGAQRVRRPESNALWCSNCFVELESAGGHETGRGRFDYLAAILCTHQPALSQGLMHDLLGSHEGDYPLCRDSTQLSFIANPAVGTMEIADGYPCRGPWFPVDETRPNLKQSDAIRPR